MRSLLVFFLLLTCSTASAQEYSEEELKSAGESITIKSKSGLHFKVPPDMPIVERDGTIYPLPMDEYFNRKLNILKGRVDSLEGKIDLLDEKLDHISEKSDYITTLLLQMAPPQEPEKEETEEVAAP